MLRYRIWGLAALLLTGLAGCSSDDREGILSKIISTANDTTGSVNRLKDHMQSAIELRKKNGETLTPPDFAKAQELINKDLKENGDFLARLKSRAEILGEQTTDADRQRFAKQYGSQLDAAEKGLEKSYRDLDKVLVDAESVVAEDGGSKKMLDELKESLKKAQNGFELLTKQR